MTNTSTTTNNTSAMTIPEIAKKASPAVVGVATKSIIEICLHYTARRIRRNWIRIYI